MLPCAEHSCRRFGSVAGHVILGDVAVEKSFLQSSGLSTRLFSKNAVSFFVDWQVQGGTIGGMRCGG
jgi:hypothetical protein